MNSKTVEMSSANDDSMPEFRKKRKFTQVNEKCVTKHLIECSTGGRTMETLPIEIIEKILQFLPPNDLAQFSVTCHKFRIAARKHFQLKRQCGLVTIDTRLRHPQVYFPKEKKDIYKIRFRDLIPRVKIILRNAKCISNVFEFVHSNVKQQLKMLEIEKKWSDDWYTHEENEMEINENILNINNRHMSMIAKQIKDVEMLVLHGKIEINLQSELFSNLRALGIFSIITFEHQAIFFNHKFPKLQTLCLNGWQCNDSEFNIFLHKNPQLKNIFCNQNECIRCILTTDIKLSNIILQFGTIGSGNNIVDVLDDLWKCSNLGNVDSIHIITNSITMQTELTGLKRITNLKSLHLTGYENIFSDYIESLPYIQQLCLSSDCYTPMTQQTLNAIVRIFPNLEKLNFCIIDAMCLVSIKDLVSSIVAGLPKLKNLYLQNCDRSEIKENIQEWDLIRLTLKNVSRLQIYFGLMNGFSQQILIKGESISVIIGAHNLCQNCYPQVDCSYLTYLENNMK